MKHSIKKLREAIRLKSQKLPTAEVSQQLGIPASTINDWVKKASHNKITPEALRVMSDAELEDCLRPRNWSREEVLRPDYEEYLVQACTPKARVQDVYARYVASVPEGKKPVSKSTFYRDLKSVEQNASVTLKEVCLLNSFRPGHMCMIDYSGDGLKWKDNDGVVHTAQIFVGVLCFSGLIFCCATARQTRQDWFSAIVSMFHAFDGVTEEIWLDNSTSLVKKADTFDPELSEDFKNLCSYYDVVGYAVAQGKCRHKALVENAVKQCQNRILKPLTGRAFFSIKEINAAIVPLLDKLNNAELVDRPGSSRRSRYQDEELIYLKPLPLIEYAPNCSVLKRKVRKNNQVRIGNTRYNVPWGLVGREILIKIDGDLRELSFIDPDDGDLLGTTKLRSPKDGPEPQRKEFLPDNVKHLVEDTDELLVRINEELGAKAYRVAQRIAKPNNSLARRHLRGLLLYGRNWDAEFMDTVYDKLLKKSIVTFRNLKDTIQRVEATTGLKPQKKRLKRGATLVVGKSALVRGADYYKGRFANNDQKES